MSVRTPSPGQARRADAVEDPSDPLFGALSALDPLSDSYCRFGAALLSEPSLSPILRELLIVVVLETCGAMQMAARHRAQAAYLGVDPMRLQNLATFETAPGFSDIERATLSFARDSALHIHVDEATFVALRTWFDLRAITVLTLLVAYYSGLAHIAVPLGIEAAQGPS